MSLHYTYTHTYTCITDFIFSYVEIYKITKSHFIQFVRKIAYTLGLDYQTIEWFFFFKTALSRYKYYT